jgi:hypothetical protein
MDTIENTEKTTGSFKPSTKFIEFVGGKGHVNFISNQATLAGKFLSGLDMDDLNFKLTIYEDGTVDFNELNTTRTSEILPALNRRELMSSFTDKLEVTPLPDGRRWELTKEFDYHVGSETSPNGRR